MGLSMLRGAPSPSAFGMFKHRDVHYVVMYCQQVSGLESRSGHIYHEHIETPHTEAKMCITSDIW